MLRWLPTPSEKTGGRSSRWIGAAFSPIAAVGGGGSPCIPEVGPPRTGGIIQAARRPAVAAEARVVQQFSAAEHEERIQEGDLLTINMGPQHPSTHGVFRMILTLDGETVVSCRPVMGYLHRSVEKLAETRTYLQDIIFTDRLDYLAPMTTNLPFAMATERLAGIEVPERGEYVRLIMCELQRFASHCVAIGTFASDAGAFFTPMMYTFRERERILDIYD